VPVGFEYIELVGHTVRLRPVREDDAADAYHLVTDDKVLANLAWDGPANEAGIAGTYRRWEKEMVSGESYCFAIERVGPSGMVGCIDARFPRHPRQADIGYWLGVPYWNNGYMTEAVRLICHLCFKYLNSARIYATVFTGNTGSRRVLEKNGFSLDGTLRQHVFKRGQFLDSWFLTLLRSEWKKDKARYLPVHENIVLVENGR